jgi:hypothetical protein
MNVVKKKVHESARFLGTIVVGLISAKREKRRQDPGQERGGKNVSSIRIWI